MLIVKQKMFSETHPAVDIPSFLGRATMTGMRTVTVNALDIK
jgi:hypothetical protein